MVALEASSVLIHIVPETQNLRLDGGAAEEDGTSSSGSLERLRRAGLIFPRLAAAMFDRKGELSS